MGPTKCGAIDIPESLAQELDTLRTVWLNPPEWTHEEVLEFPASVDSPWRRYVVSDLGGVFNPDRSRLQTAPTTTDQAGVARYPRRIPKDADCARKLAKRKLTNLYNERLTWLANAHTKLDAAVFAAYGWPVDVTDEQILERLLKLNLERADGDCSPVREVCRRCGAERLPTSGRVLSRRNVPE